MVIHLRKSGKKTGRTIHSVAYVEQLDSAIQYTTHKTKGGISDVQYISIENRQFRYKGMLYDFCSVYDLSPQEETKSHGWKS